MLNLTDNFIKSLKPKQKRYDITINDGFQVRVYPSGIKVFQYRYKINKKPKRLTFGRYPGLSIREAKSKHLEASALKANGKDPAEALFEKKEHTVEMLVEEFLTLRSIKKKDQGVEDRRVLEKDVIPEIGSKPAGEVTRRDIAKIIDKIMLRGADRQANITLTKICTIYNFALDRGYPGVESNPAHKMKRPGVENEGDRSLSDEEIKQFWHGIATGRKCDIASRAQTIKVLRLILLTGQRPGECLGIEYEEIDGNWWTIPTHKTKNGLPHRVYLSATAKDILGEGKGRVFPARAGSQTRVNKLSYTVRRLLSTTKSGVIRLPMEKWTPHDLRRTASTGLAALGYRYDIIDHFLSHKPPKLRRTYNKYKYDLEKRTMAEAWGEKILELINSTTQHNALQLLDVHDPDL